MQQRLLEHPHAPRWRGRGSDRLQPEDLAPLRHFARQLADERRPFDPGPPPSAICEWVSRVRSVTPFYHDRIPLDFASHWTEIPVTSREDVALRPELFVPNDADLGPMIVYRTAGTTGHAMHVPHHPRAVAAYQPFMEFVLGRYGICPKFDADTVACFLVCAQKQTITWATTLAYWRGAGFAKVNLNPAEWPSPRSASRYFADLKPLFLNGDPFSFSEMLQWNLPVQPAAMFSTAVALRPGLKKRLHAQFACPVIDWFSLIETGPIAYACPLGQGHHLLPPDIFVEVLDESMRPAPPGVRGELVITGGRNPYLPLVRYRTQDWGALDLSPCACGDPMPKILDLEGRRPVRFRSADGAVVNSADLSRVLREFPLVQHEFQQLADLTCEITVRPIAGVKAPEDEIRAVLQRLLGKVPLILRQDPELGNQNHTGKVISYRSELLTND